MPASRPPHPEEVDELLRNAQLRDEIEPYWDEAIISLNPESMTTRQENELLESMLAWERAPSRPISQWFEPELKLPHPAALADEPLQRLLWETIHKLYEQRVVLEFTDHLSDRELYLVVYRDILPCCEKQMDVPGRWLHWDCADVAENPEVYLRYYASDEERESWAESFPDPMPEHEEPPYRRHLPEAGM